MKVLYYYFIYEYQWRDKWFSEFGISKPRIYASEEFVKKNRFIDYSLLESLFIADHKFDSLDKVTKILGAIKEKIKMNDIYYIGNEIVGLEINKEFSRPIDYLGDSEGKERPLSWNVVIPNEYQLIPTIEILELIEDWGNFLSEVTRKNRSIY